MEDHHEEIIDYLESLYPGDWIYYLAPESLSAIKIGKVTGPHMYASRFKQLQAMNHERLYCLAIKQPRFNRGERAEHRKFAENRLHGEWFRTCLPLLISAECARLQNRNSELREYELIEWMLDEDALKQQIERVQMIHTSCKRKGIDVIHRRGCATHERGNRLCTCSPTYRARVRRDGINVSHNFATEDEAVAWRKEIKRAIRHGDLSNDAVSI